MTQRTWVLSGTAILALGALGCATQGPKPTEEMTRARTVIEQADKGGNAQRYAAADLQKAHDELNNAEKADQARRYDEARRYAETAEADADVATARGNAGDAQRAAKEVQKSNETLESESSRNVAGAATTPNPPATAPLDTSVPNNSVNPGTDVPR
jgi:hypothetical protein